MESMGTCWNDTILGLKSFKFSNSSCVYYIDVNDSYSQIKCNMRNNDVIVKSLLDQESTKNAFNGKQMEF